MTKNVYVTNPVVELLLALLVRAAELGVARVLHYLLLYVLEGRI